MTSPNSNGTVSVTVDTSDKETGEYSAKINYSGNDKYNQSSGKTKVTLEEKLNDPYPIIFFSSGSNQQARYSLSFVTKKIYNRYYTYENLTISELRSILNQYESSFTFYGRNEVDDIDSTDNIYMFPYVLRPTEYENSEILGVYEIYLELNDDLFSQHYVMFTVIYENGEFKPVNIQWV